MPKLNKEEINEYIAEIYENRNSGMKKNKNKQKTTSRHECENWTKIKAQTEEKQDKKNPSSQQEPRSPASQTEYKNWKRDH